jgi:hypothetical protein
MDRPKDDGTDSRWGQIVSAGAQPNSYTEIAKRIKQH